MYYWLCEAYEEKELRYPLPGCMEYEEKLRYSHTQAWEMNEFVGSYFKVMVHGLSKPWWVQRQHPLAVQWGHVPLKLKRL